MLKIEWVNHASFIVDDGEIRLITDPWLEGSVFNESWSLISKTKFQYEDFKNINYIWFSHEHPDHFFPPNIKKIPEEYRKNITVLFHKTRDQKVVKFCQHLGFKEIIELDSEYIKLSKNTEMYIEKFDDYSLDSWFYLKSHGKTILNVNDCVLNSKKIINNLLGKIGHVDYLFTQFSYANWVGNPKDIEGRKKHADEKLKRIQNQLDIFKPKFLVPFASYVYFSHEDNFFMNETINSIRTTYKEFEKDIDTLVFYPGDEYNTADNWTNSELNIDKYEKDLKQAIESPLKKFPTVSIEEIKEKYQNGPFYTFDLQGVGARFLIRSLGTSKVVINIKDLDINVDFNIVNKSIDITDSKSDITMHSQTLSYLLSFLWGPSTILIAGTIYDVNKNGFDFMKVMSEVSQAISNNQTFNLKFSFLRFFDVATKKMNRVLESL